MSPANGSSTREDPAQASFVKRSLQLGILLTLGALAADLLTPYHLAIIYPLPVLLCAWAGRRRLVWGSVTTLIILVFLGYFLGPHALENRVGIERLFNFRLVNRVIAAGAVLAAGVLSHICLRDHQGQDLGDALQSDAGDIHQEDTAVLYWLSRLNTLLLGLLSAIVVLAMDMAVPVKYNLPILYTLPVLICVLREDRLLLWGMTPLVLLFTAISYMADPPVAESQSVLHVMVRNRMLAAGMVVGIAAVGNFWLARTAAALPHQHLMGKQVDAPVQ